ncbi:MAG: ABC transporter permease [Propionibacteriaceae bacterium]
MIKATLKSLTSHKARLLLSLLAIVLGISFLCGVMTFNRMINSTFDSLMSATQADVSISPSGTYSENYNGGVVATQPLSSTAIDQVRAVAGVEAAYGSSWRPNTFLLDKNGKVIHTPMTPNLGGNFNPGRAYLGKQAQKIVTGRAPMSMGEVAIDSVSLAKGGFAVGDTITVAIAESGKHQFTIVGEMMWGESATTGGATYAAFSDTAMQKYFYDGETKYDQIWVVAKPGVDVVELAKRINSEVKITGYEAFDGKMTSARTSEQIHKQTSFLGTFLMVFALIALVVGMFLIVNTFSIIVVQRSRELALYRTLGASRRQIRASILFEASIIGLIGSLAGIAGGWVLAALMKPLVNSASSPLISTVLSPDMRTIVICLVVGIVTTVIAAYLPARKAAKVAPMVAINYDEASSDKKFGKHVIIGTVLAGLGAVVLAISLMHSGLSHLLMWVGAGAGLMVIGVAMASPLVGYPFTWIMDKIYSGIGGQIGHLAATNSMRNPRRTAATASALMIGVTVVTTVGVLGASLEKSMHAIYREQLNFDALVQASGYSGWKPEVTESMRHVAGVDKVWSMTFGTATDAEKPDKQYSLTGVDPAMVGKVMEQKLSSGRAISAQNEIMVTEKEAKSSELSVGQNLKVRVGQKEATLMVVGIFTTKEGIGLGSIQTSRQTLLELGFPDVDYLGAVQLVPGTALDPVMAELTRVTADYPMVTVTDKEAYATAQAAQIDKLLAMIYALLAIAVIIAIFGVINTLVLSIIERKREIGLLRAVGLTRRQLRIMVGLESIIIALLGAALGIGMGLVFGIAFQRSMASKGITMLQINWAQLGVLVALAAIVGMLAAIVPAIWASRLKVLDAVQAR